jgi:hypothetical protein
MRNSSVIILSRTRLRTRANSAESSTGLVRKSSAPASRPATRSAGLVERRHHHDGHMRGLGIVLDAAADFETVHARHHHVEQHDIGIALLDLGQRLEPVERGDDLEIFGRQLRFEQLDVGQDVIDDENPRGHGCSR